MPGIAAAGLNDAVAEAVSIASSLRRLIIDSLGKNQSSSVANHKAHKAHQKNNGCFVIVVALVVILARLP